MSTHEIRPLHEFLAGEDAFYVQADYKEKTLAELASPKALKPPAYIYNTETKTHRILSLVLSILIFPVALYKLIHIAVAKFSVIPGSSPWLLTLLLGFPPGYANYCRKKINLDGEWKFKRITVETDGTRVDAMIMGKADTLGNGRWILVSNGNAEFYEEKVSFGYAFKKMVSNLDANALVFNYPGVGASSGPPSRKKLWKAYNALFALLEDQDLGMRAKEIITFDHSIGGGVFADALEDHTFKEGIVYVFVKRQIFSTTAKFAAYAIGYPFGLLAQALGWNMRPIDCSKKLKQPEIILQTARVEQNTEIHDPLMIVDDTVIPAQASLAYALLSDEKCPKKNKYFVGIPEGHNEPLSDPTYLSEKIHTLLNDER